MILADLYSYPADFHEKSRKALELALSTAPAYSDWRRHDPGASAPLDVRYDSLPMLTKDIMRRHFPTGLVPNHRDIDDGLLRMEIEYTFTSGTTGDRVINIWDQDWWDRSEASSWKLNAHLSGLTYPPHREAKLASSLNVGISCEEDLPMSHRIAGNKLYLNEKISLIQWQPRHFRRMADELDEFKPVVLEANPSLLARLAAWSLDEGVTLYSPAAIVFTYELISAFHLAVIKKAFSCPLVSSYGTTETGFVLEECECGFMHQNLDYCRIDFYPLKTRYGGPEVGRILVTTFDNPWNSIIKFDTGDLVRLYPRGKCLCGRNQGMIVQSIEGRVSNSTFTTSGALVTGMDADRALITVPGIRDYHLEQDSEKDYSLEVMLDPGAKEAALEGARKALIGLYGPDGRFTVTQSKNLIPGPAGKFRRTHVNFGFDWETLFE